MRWMPMRKCLPCARENAGAYQERIRFHCMDAGNLNFEDQTFDLIVSRNLTWNLPDPQRVYQEWKRVLKPGGTLLVYDANWYGYLVHQDLRKKYEEDRRNVAEHRCRDFNIGDRYDQMEKLAAGLPMTSKIRPQWDREVLENLGFRKIHTDTEVWKRVWSEEEKINFASTPLFVIEAAA